MPDVDLPAPVDRLQEVLAGRARLLTLRALLDGSKTFGELTEQLPYSNAGVRASLQELAALGYVSDDSPDGRLRKSTAARFTVDRDLVLRDLGALLLYIAR